MRKKLIYIFVILPILVIAQSAEQNWVKSKVYKDSTKTSISLPSAAQAVTQVSYFDGLGRPIQQVAHAQSNTGKDIITHIEYDSFGRKVREYLPFIASGTASLNIKTNEVFTFYGSNNPSLTGNPNFEVTQFPFSEKQLEASPLNRVLKQSAPGEDWNLNSGHEIELDYQTNSTSDTVKLYKAKAEWEVYDGLYKISLIDANVYNVNQLYKSITKDENHTSGNNNTTQEFKNKEGQVVLKRTFADIIVNGILLESAAKHDTYYIYDQFGNLTYVIPPAVNTSLSITQSILDNMCYQYKYDYRNRLVEKKLPGKQWEYIVYDKLDRVVATGPAYNPYGGSDTNKGWMLTKYDSFNRPVYTGWYNAPVNNTADRKTLQDSYNNATLFSESKTVSANLIDGISTKYTNQVSPSTFILLTVNYYDSYDYPNAPSPFPTSVETQNTTTNVKGLPTGSWVRTLDVINSTSNELSYTIYDKRYRPIRSYTKNYLGGYTQLDSKLDWAGKTEFTVTKHKQLSSSTEIITKDMFEYSNQDKLVKHKHEIVGYLPEQLLSYNTYDELGQLISKKVGGTDVSANVYLQKIDYSYNIRGWLKGINDVTNLAPTTENDLFAFKINYNNNSSLGLGDILANNLFNGNISSTYWKTAGDNILRKYNYKYDDLNRLLEANYNKPQNNTTTDNYLEKLTYDKNGNIKSIIRNGNLDPSGGAMANEIDNLFLTYDTDNQNLLKTVVDNSTSPQGFKDSASNTVPDYDYDKNGNMTLDNNKGITGIIYNHLNLPTKILFGTKGNIVYIYNAIGKKIEKKVTQGTTITTSRYINGYQYVNTVLQFFPHNEGYINVKTGPVFNYVFNYTDHLGNIRLSYAKDVVTNTLKILEESHYYAFGLKHQNYNVEELDFNEIGIIKPKTNPLVSTSYKYKYNGQELQEELGLNMTAMDFRQYDSTIGRFMGMDMLSELTQSWSPYRFAFNNPVIWADPTGLKEEGVKNNQYFRTSNQDNLTGYYKDKNNVVYFDPNVHDQGDAPKDTTYLGETYLSYDGETFWDENGKSSPMGTVIKEIFVTNRNKKNTTNSTDYFGLTFSSADVSLGTHNDYLYNHTTYPTTKGIEKNILKLNGEVRSSQAAKYLKYSKYIKGTALVGSSLSTGYAGYKISNGTATTIDYADGGVGLTGILVSVGSSLGYISATVSNPVGWAVGGYGSIRLLQDLLEGYEPKGNGVGVFYDHNIGTYSIK